MHFDAVEGHLNSSIYVSRKLRILLPPPSAFLGQDGVSLNISDLYQSKQKTYSYSHRVTIDIFLKFYTSSNYTHATFRRIANHKLLELSFGPIATILLSVSLRHGHVLLWDNSYLNNCMQGNARITNLFE